MSKTTKIKRGPPKVYETKILVPMKLEVLADIDAVIDANETRNDLIRSAIEREIERRSRVHSLKVGATRRLPG